METVIKKLSEIEIAAKKILEEANGQLQDLSEQIQKKTADFDIQTTQNTEKKLTELRQKLETQTAASLDKLKDDADRISASLNRYYSENHDQISDMIYKKIIGM